MNVKMIIKQSRLISLILISAIFFIGLVFIMRGLSMSQNKLPLSIEQKVRNLSAHETEWQVATVAAPGDVIEHFALIHASDSLKGVLKNIRVACLIDARQNYRAKTLVSSSQGINEEMSETAADNFFGNGLEAAQIKSGEFMDFRWQTQLQPSLSFNEQEIPLINTSIKVEADSYGARAAKTLLSVYSTRERAEAAPVKSDFYLPRAISMNPRTIYDDLGGGVLIAGSDLTGVKTLRLAGSNKILAWRLISNELLEAGLPAGLTSGEQQIEFIDNQSKIIKDKISFTVLSSANRAVVIKATPNVIKQGTRRIIVLQGIHLKNAKELIARNGSEFKLENINQINDRALSAEIPAEAPKGEYKLFVGEYEQDVKLTVN